MVDKNQLVLMGFGAHDLSEILSWIGDPVKEQDALEAFKKWPARYRRLAICEQEDVDNCIKYAQYLSEQLSLYDEFTKPLIEVFKE